MKIAISTDNGMVSAHFGRCPEFTIVEIENNEVVKQEVIPNPGHHPGFLPQFLSEKGVSFIVAGGMGKRAEMLFEENKIKSYLGISGSVVEVIEKLAQNKLQTGTSLCQPGGGKGYGVEKTECTHEEEGEA